MNTRANTTAATRRVEALAEEIVAAAPTESDGTAELLDELNEAMAREASAGDQGDVLHEFCEDWAFWCFTRRYYARLSLPPSLLGRLQQRGARALRSVGGPDAQNSAALAAFHLAVLGQPAEALDRQVFELYYIHRVKNVKAAAAAVGIGRQHWYTLLREFRRRAFNASQDILRHNLSEGDSLPHRANTPHE